MTILVMIPRTVMTWPLVTRCIIMLDLARRNEWKQCADMPQPRYSFGCGLMHGKIYIFGSRTSGGLRILESWVYDPSKTSWSSIKSMQEMRTHPQVLAMGERLFVHGRRFEVPDGIDFNHFALGTQYESDTEVYHPGKNKWTVELHCPSKDKWPLFYLHQHMGSLGFTAEGKLHMITPIAVHQHSIDSDGDFAWTLLHTFEEVYFATRSDSTYQVGRYVTARGEQTVLLRTIGFGSDKEKISWEKILCGIVQHVGFLISCVLLSFELNTNWTINLENVQFFTVQISPLLGRSINILLLASEQISRHLKGE